jgi:hypothetical protein
MCIVNVVCGHPASPIEGAENLARELIREAVGQVYERVEVEAVGSISFSLTCYRGKEAVKGTIRRTFGKWQVVVGNRAVGDLADVFDQLMKRDFVVIHEVMDGVINHHFPLVGLTTLAAVAWVKAKYETFKGIEILENGDVVVGV